MSILRLGHKHISSGTLNEYLDGRLAPRDQGRVERVTAECSDCREELESLRQIATMLRQLPVLSPSRGFVLEQAPLEIRQQPTRPWFQVPQWAYAGAASMAVLALALLITLDVSGLVAPDLPDTMILKHSTDAVTPADLELLRREIAGAKEAPQAIEAAPARPEIEQAVQAESAASAVDEPPVTALQAEADSSSESQALSRAAPVEPIEDSPAKPEITVDDTAAIPAPVPGESRSPVLITGPTPGTPLFWRILEAAAAALVLVLTVTVVWKRRASNRF
ncbi:MAG: hypothetical protein BZY88_11710 [SAR202 cluster bacterium Io17-Chloro-G9]|nr:MAG: hypothetical protein BZY88_11710 [SAR202 cluster bacterium Io17-Chloro-G9]